MKRRCYCYMRFATVEQCETAQNESIREEGKRLWKAVLTTTQEFPAGNRILAGGKDLDRSGYKALKTAILRPGDTLVVKSLDRLSRNKADIKNELQFFKENGIRLKVLDLPTTLVDYPVGQEWVLDMVNNILIEVLASIAQQERQTIRQRQAEGIAAAKANGRHLGRPKAEKPDNWEAVITRWKNGEITAAEAMRQTGIKRSTFYKLNKLDG